MFWRILRQNPSRPLAVASCKNPKKLTRFWCAKSRMCRNETPGRIVTKCCTGVGVHDAITCADLYYDRLRGLGVAGCQILGFSIDLLRRPYNTLALPCECVICCAYCSVQQYAACMSVCLSVFASVCLTHAGINSKMITVGSCCCTLGYACRHSALVFRDQMSYHRPQGNIYEGLQARLSK